MTIIMEMSNQKIGTACNHDREKYASRVMRLFDKYADIHGFIHGEQTFGFSSEVGKIVSEADAAVDSGKSDVAFDALTGITDVSGYIIVLCEDSYGYIGKVFEDCFKLWRKLASRHDLPEDVKTEVFDFAMDRFRHKHLKNKGMHWEWMSIAVKLADTPDRLILAKREIASSLEELSESMSLSQSDVLLKRDFEQIKSLESELERDFEQIKSLESELDKKA